MADPLNPSEDFQTNPSLAGAGLELPISLWEQMLEDVMSRQPEEACGLVAGLERRARQVYPVTNALHSPVRFRMAPEEQVRIFLSLEALGLDLLAIYHSHPAGPDRPSPTDLAEAAYPEAVHLIWSPQAGEWACRGYLVRDGKYQEIPVLIIEG